MDAYGGQPDEDAGTQKVLGKQGTGRGAGAFNNVLIDRYAGHAPHPATANEEQFVDLGPFLYQQMVLAISHELREVAEGHKVYWTQRVAGLFLHLSNCASQAMASVRDVNSLGEFF